MAAGSTQPGDAQDLDDAELVGRCAGGDEAAWAELVHRYKRLVYAIPSRAGLPPEAADDVFQIVFSRLAAHIQKLKNPDRVRAWLVTTARRLTLDAVRRPRPLEASEAVLEHTPDPGTLASDEVEELERQHLIRQALTRLTERCQRLLHLLYYSGDPPPYETVAEQLAMPVGSVGPTRARCLQKLLHEFELLGD